MVTAFIWGLLLKGFSLFEELFFVDRNKKSVKY